MISSIRNHRRAALFGCGLLFAVVLAWVVFPPAHSDAAGKTIRDSWSHLLQGGQYDFSTTVEQVTFPAPALSNVGQSSTKEVYQITGRADLHNDTLNIRLFQNQGSLLDNADGVEIQITDGKASGRAIGATEWQSLDSYSAANFNFGSNGASFVTAARNVRELGSQTIELPVEDGSTVPVSVTRYSFDVDSDEYALLMRDQMVAELQRAGKLPLGMQLSVSDQYRSMVSSGEVWVNDSGLPVRMTVTMKMPPEKNGDHVEATITTDYFNHNNGALMASLPLPYRMAGALGLPTSPRALGELTAQLSVLAAGALLLTLMVVFSSKKLVYAGVGSLVILSMLISPIWNGEKAAVFAKEIQTKNASMEAERQQARQEQEAYKAAYSSDWNPHANPLERVSGVQSAVDPAAKAAGEQPLGLRTLFDEAHQAQAGSETGETDVDTDGDGLTDAYEIGSNPENPDPDDPYPILNPYMKDTDEDGLDDNVELLLNLAPGEVDTDLDGIWDIDEVRPFRYNVHEELWYLNPEERDTDMDGQLDGAECPERKRTDPNVPFGEDVICRDTNGDGIPDAFDPDDDGDGIPTAYDESPYVVNRPVHSDQNPLKLTIDGVEVGRTGLIHYQLIPSNKKHLTYALNVLDWPSGDADGQIQRVSDTTYADSLTPDQAAQDPRAKFGDMRLIPMAEIYIPGNSIPFPMSDTVVVDFSITGLSGSFEFKGLTNVSTEVTLTKKLNPPAEGPISQAIRIGEGSCEEFKSVADLDLHSVNDTVTTNLALGDLVDGNHVLAFFEPGSSNYLCSPIPAVAHGNSETNVIDSSILQSYGGAVRDDGAGSVLVYVPLSVDYDETGGHPVAFSARIPYDNSLNGLNGAQHEVRVIWLINMLADECLAIPPHYDENASGAWCDPKIPERWNEDVSRVVHTYTEEFTLAGLSVVEEHGVEMAVIFEDPATDPEPDFDDPLWGMANALERTFLAGRQDINVDEIKNRFDPATGDDSNPNDDEDPRLWGLGKNTFQVERYSYANPDGVSAFVSDQATRLFDTYFTGAGAPDIANLLFAREISQRATSAGEAGWNCDATGCALDLTAKPLTTQAMINWAPYQRKDGVWQPYPINEYLDQLEARLRGIDFDGPDATYTDAAEEKHVLDGMIAMVKLYYRNLYSGIATLVKINDDPVINAPSLLSDENVFSDYKSNLSKGQLVGKVITTIVTLFIDGYLLRPALLADLIAGTRAESIKAFFQMFGMGLEQKVSPITKLLTSTFRKVALGIGIAVFIAGIATLAVLYLNGDNSPTGKWAGRVLFMVLSLVSAVLAGAALYSAIKAVKCVSDNAKAAAIVGAIIGVVIAWGIFIYTWASTGVSFGSLAFNNMLAEAIAATITVLLMAALSATGVGAIIVAVIGLIDALIGAICAITGANELEEDHWARQYICIGITGWVTKIIKWVIYSNTYLIDYDNGERLELNEVDQDLQNENLGISVGNHMKITLGVKNTITKSSVPIDWKAAAYFWQYSDSNAKSSTFNYKLQTTESDIHDGLNRGDISGKWVSLGGSKWELEFKAASDGYSIPVPHAGINVDPTAYLSEGSALPVQECWAIPMFYPIFFLIPVCYIRTERATVNSEISSSLTVDAFPSSLDSFYSLAADQNGYKLSWGQSGSVKFPILRDADGDGLMSKAFSGNDPDDSDFDTDNDGLNDYFEIAYGSNPNLVDTDDDGLNDYLEVLAQTSPTRKDTDGDGLTDGEEMAGWLYTYDFDETGAPFETMVYPDPLMADTDLDGVTDYLEKVFGFHPRVRQNADVLEYELAVREQDSPLIMLRLNESSGAMVFDDSSNFGFAGSCSAEECPLAGLDGRFGAAARFDGTDLLRLPTTAKAVSLGDDHPFTIAGWVNDEGGGTLFSKWSGAAGSQTLLRFDIAGSGHLRLTSSADQVTSAVTVPSGAWTHVAVIFDGTNADFYINGNHAGGANFSVPAPAGGSTPSEIMLGAFQDENGPAGYYQGFMDEVAFFDHAISAEVLGRWMDGLYNFNDSFVRPGEELIYQSTVTNLLNSRFAYGLLTTAIDKVNAIVDWASKLLPTTFVLYPDNPVVTEVNTEVFETHLQIEPGHAVSEDVTFTQTAEAQIVDRRTESNLAELWLQFEETADATTFIDQSGNMPPRNATCAACPVRNQAGILNQAVKFAENTSARIDLPDLQTLKLLNHGFTVSMWVRPMNTAETGERIPLLQSDSDQLTIELVRKSDGSFVPEVWVGGVAQTFTSWRTLKTFAWSHLVVEYFSTTDTLKIYINGGEVASLKTASLLETNAGLWLGGSSAPTDYYVDDLRIFSRPLTITDVNRMAERTVLELKMGDDGTGFVDSSGYGTTVTKTYNTPGQSTQAVRGYSLDPKTGSSQASLTVSNNTLLDMSDGSFTFSVWIYPRSGSTSNWQGIFGKRNSDTDTNAYPTLERSGKKLRFSFGGSKGYQSVTTDDILTENKWNHVTVTFAPDSLGSDSHILKLYIDSVLKKSVIIDDKPRSNSTFYVGISSVRFETKVGNLHMDDEHDAGSHAEVTVEEYFNGVYQGDLIYDKSMGDGDVYDLNTTRTNSHFGDFATVRYEVWEEDSSSGDDRCGTISFYWYEYPRTGSLSLSNGFDGSLDYWISRPSVQFHGLIDELQVYRYAIDSEQVYDQYYAIPVTARLPLDDRPASNTFDNRAVIGEMDDGKCNGLSCPAAGTIGLINQAVRFDGADDVISVPVVTTEDYMVSLWVNSTCQNCGVYSLEKEGGALAHQLYLKGGNICSLAGTQEICSQGGTVTDGQWHYVVYTNDGSVANLWLDGSVVNSRSTTQPVDYPGRTAKLGYAPAAAKPAFNGQLDDVRIFRYVQDNAAIAAIQKRAPLFLAHLDEPDGSTLFEDATPNDFQLGCSGDACPNAGFEGRLRTAAQFTQNADVLTLNQARLSTTATEFSASVWVYPTETKETVTQSILTIANGSNSAPRAAISLKPGSLFLNVQDGQNQKDSYVELIKNTWNLVTLVVEPAPGGGETYYLYINGYLDSSWTSTTAGTGLGKLTLGNDAGFAGFNGGSYFGRIDEVAVYEHALNEIDVREIFAYQMGQVEETASITLTIDADDPQAELISFNEAFPYINEADRVLHVEATDPTSGIGMVEMLLDHPNAPDVVRTVAPICQDAPGGTAYCPTFIPEYGDGVYTLSFRAVDQVGNESTSRTYQFLVDREAPTIFANLLDQGLYKAERHRSIRKTWFLHLEGRVLDKTLSQDMPGSGLDLNSMKVTIYSEKGEVVGKGTQLPELTPGNGGYNWSLDYLFPETEPTGWLEVVIEIADRVGNLATHTIHILLDATAPQARMKSNQAPAGDGYSLFDESTLDDKFITGGTVSGTVNDDPDRSLPYMTDNGEGAVSGVDRVETAFEPSLGASYLYNEPYPQGLLAWLPLDNARVPEDSSGIPNEDADARYFLDISPFQFSGVCYGANCPVNGETGHKNGSIYFDGQERYINLGSKVDLANRSFSALIWARRDAAGHSDPFMWQGPLSMAGQRFLFGLDHNDRLVCGFGGSDLLTANTHPDTGWHAYACTYDRDTGRRTLYRDGQVVASDTANPVPAMNEDMLIGYAPVGSFAGSLDELMVLDRALSAGEIREAYTGYQTVYHLTVNDKFISNGDVILDASGYFQTGTLQTGDDDPLNKVTDGAVGNYALHFDGNDRLMVNPAFSLQLDRGAFTQTAWVRPMAGAGASGIISQLDENPELRYPSIYMTDEFGLQAGFGYGTDWEDFSTQPGILQPGAWNFIAARFDGTTYSLFVNGQQVAQTDALQGKQPYPANRFSIGEQFGGDIDDVKIFTRPLTDLEITAMARSGWRSAALTGSTWTANVLPGLEGPYRIDVRGWDRFGHFSTDWNVDHQWSGVVDTLAPRYSVTRTLDPDDPYLAHYTFSVEDTQLDINSIRQNVCDDIQVTYEYFNSSWYLATGAPPNTALFRASGTCSADTRTLETTGFYVCDLAGNCVMQEYPAMLPEKTYLPFVTSSGPAGVPSLTPQQAEPLSTDQVERAMQWSTLTDTITRQDGGQAPYLEIWTEALTPEDARSILHANLRGMVSNDGTVAAVQVEILQNGESIYSTTAAVYEGLWNGAWVYPPGDLPPNGTYTLRVTAVDAAGNQTRVEQDILVHLLP